MCVWCVCLLNISWCVYWRLSMAAESKHTCVWGCQLITFLCVLSFINIWLDMVGWVESTQTHVWHCDGVLVAAIETCFPPVTLDAISSTPPPVYDDHDNSCDDDAQEFKIKLATNCNIVSVIILTISAKFAEMSRPSSAPGSPVVAGRQPVSGRGVRILLNIPFISFKRRIFSSLCQRIFSSLCQRIFSSLCQRILF